MPRLTQAQIDDLKKLDLAALVARDLGPARAQRNGHLLWRCPFHDDHNPSFDVNTALNRAFCNPCGKALDPISWTMDYHRVDFREACRLLGAMPDLPPVHIAPAPKADKLYAPPPADWQIAAGQIVERCRENLWADEPRAARVRRYLHRRGLHDATLERWRVGYNPKSRTIQGLWCWAGVIIPAYLAGDLWGVKIRLLPDHPAKCQNCAAEISGAGACGNCGKGNKYRAIKGSEPALYSAHTLPRRVAFVCEGEFDAMLLHQECHELGAVVTTTNGAGKEWRAEWLRYLLDCERVITVMDNDEAGARGQAKSAALSAANVVSATVPDGRKDITDYHVAGGQLYEWLRVERLVALAATNDIGSVARRAAAPNLPPTLLADYRADLAELVEPWAREFCGLSGIRNPNGPTPAQQELLDTIIANVGEDGMALSLFEIAVAKAGQDYHQAWKRLLALERNRYVHVSRRRGQPLAMIPLGE